MRLTCWFPRAVLPGQPLPSSLPPPYVMLTLMHVLTLALLSGFASAASVLPAYPGLSARKADLVKANLAEIATHRYVLEPIP